jgi:Rrf2 family protein
MEEGRRMKITTKGRYALRIMVDLAQHQEQPSTPLSEISQRQGISLKYMEMIVGLLNKAGFVTSTRGKKGGYHLNGAPESFTVNEILKLTEGSLAPVACLMDGKVDCPRARQCEALPMWIGLEKAVDDYLRGYTIADLVKQAELGASI